MESASCFSFFNAATAACDRSLGDIELGKIQIRQHNLIAQFRFRGQLQRLLIVLPCGRIIAAIEIAVAQIVQRFGRNGIVLGFDGNLQRILDVLLAFVFPSNGRQACGHSLPVPPPSGRCDH